MPGESRHSVYGFGVRLVGAGAATGGARSAKQDTRNRMHQGKMCDGHPVR